METFNNNPQNVYDQLRQNVADLKNKLVSNSLNNSLTDISVEDVSKFCNQIKIAAKIILSTVTKLHILISSPPITDDKDSKILIRQMENGLFSMVSGLCNIIAAKNCICLYTTIKQNVMYTLESVEDFVDTVIKINNCSDIIFKRKTGIVWERCEYFENMPMSNIEAIVLKLKEQISLIEDAIYEVNEYENEESLENSFSELQIDEMLKWNDNEHILVDNTIKFVKIPLSIIQSICSLLHNKCNSEFAEDFYNKSKNFSSLIDELISNVYPPIEKKSFQEAIEKLKETIIVLFQTFPHYDFITEENDDWLAQEKQNFNNCITLFFEIFK